MKNKLVFLSLVSFLGIKSYEDGQPVLGSDNVEMIHEQKSVELQKELVKQPEPHSIPSEENPNPVVKVQMVGDEQLDLPSEPDGQNTNNEQDHSIQAIVDDIAKTEGPSTEDSNNVLNTEDFFEKPDAIKSEPSYTENVENHEIAGETVKIEEENIAKTEAHSTEDFFEQPDATQKDEVDDLIQDLASNVKKLNKNKQNAAGPESDPTALLDANQESADVEINDAGFNKRLIFTLGLGSVVILGALLVYQKYGLVIKNRLLAMCKRIKNSTPRFKIGFLRKKIAK
ncbi:hypothetical protein EKK58_02425 [Candidatus Dependentiae bacterium]|nr:MAG: hypothetical protein EKK58_02425 [Candidatus Dependentiae bacterium]